MPQNSFAQLHPIHPVKVSIPSRSLGFAPPIIASFRLLPPCAQPERVEIFFFTYARSIFLPPPCNSHTLDTLHTPRATLTNKLGHPPLNTNLIIHLLPRESTLTLLLFLFPPSPPNHHHHHYSHHRQISVYARCVTPSPPTPFPPGIPPVLASVSSRIAASRPPVASSSLDRC